jgi:hypothetical protein
MTEILRRQNEWTLLVKFLPTSLLDVSSVICQRALADESEIISTQIGTHSRSANGRRAWDALYDTTP